MVLKSLREKSRAFVFKSFGNMDTEEPAKIFFSRFPLPDESFPMANQKQVLDSSAFRNLDDGPRSREALVDHIINNMVENLTANRVDLKRFFGECVEGIGDLAYGGKTIQTASEFFEFLPAEAAFSIAQEAYLYAKESDEFRAEDKKK